MKSTENLLDPFNRTTEDVFGHDIKPLVMATATAKTQKVEVPKIPKMKIALVREGAIFEKAKGDKGNAGYDLKAFDMQIKDGYIQFMLGVISEAPEGYYWEIVHKSSNSKFNFILANTKGTIDSNFRGEWQARLKIIPQPQIFDQPNNGLLVQNHIGAQYIQLWQEGEIALQAILHKEPEHEIVFVNKSELTDTERGEGGHGSTGNGLTK